MEQIANPVFNDQLAGQLAQGGHVWITVALVALQAILIPATRLLVKSWKSSIDAERAVTKLERDNQYHALDTRITLIEKNTDHKIEELAANLQNMNKTLERLFERFDKMTEMVTEIWHSYKNSGRRKEDRQNEA